MIHDAKVIKVLTEQLLYFGGTSIDTQCIMTLQNMHIIVYGAEMQMPITEVYLHSSWKSYQPVVH